ncbi:MAG: hypothetical protein KKB50_01860 [Planctomycetes bacterium]|nr:hypothetical protein [Planctomycetota bacterium]
MSAATDHAGESPSTPDSPTAAPTALLALALVSTALIACEIVLMRRLLIERWHHFGYLVISVALLGFGVSGTLLAILERPVRRWPVTTLWLSALTTALAIALLPRIAARMPITARILPADLWRQVGWWSLYWLLAATPFLLGAAHIGTALMTAGRRIGRTYAVNLFGSGVGAVAGALLVSRMALEHTYWPSITLTLLAALVLAVRRDVATSRGGRSAAVGITVLCIAALVWLEARRPLPLAPDEYKGVARVQQLVRQGSARLVSRTADPHGYVEVYESDLFHDLPFLALTHRPPPMLSIQVNGDPAGSVLRIDNVAQAGVLDTTLTALPYRLLGPAPRVLLIGEAGGTNVWLARRYNAAFVDVVQPNGALAALLRGPLVNVSGGVHKGDDLGVWEQAPRGFVDVPPPSEEHKYGLIQLVSLEGLGLGATGTRGLAEDHLVTVEGLAKCLQWLRGDGLLAVCRGLEFPERANIRLLATLVEALESLAVADPQRHLVQVRDYLGVCTMVLRSPLDESRRQQLTAAIRELNLTPVWYANLAPQDVNQPDALPGPSGSAVDWLHHAASEIFSTRREAFYRGWFLNIRPVHDDNPFFWDFYKPEAVTVLREAYGDLWLTRAELGRLFLYASLAITAAAALLLILGPLAIARFIARRRKTDMAAPAAPTLATVIYFAAIGLGFMGIEMALISRGIRWLGDPVMASAVVIGGLLVLSGLGSLTGRRVLCRGAGTPRAWPAAALVALLTLCVAASTWTGHARIGSILVAICALPLAYCMGTPMPAGLAALSIRAPTLVPWAWGINGVASVIGATVAMAVAMSVGYRYVFLLAVLLYGLAAIVALSLANRTLPAHNGQSPGRATTRHNASDTGARA